jgi:hypothetical protein
VLRSTAPLTAWSLSVGGANPWVSYVDVSDSDASGGAQIVAENSVDSDRNTNWDFAPPAATVNLSAAATSTPRQLRVMWSAPADDGITGDPLNGEYRLQYTTSSVEAGNVMFWSTASAQIVISTNGITPGVLVSTGLSNVPLNTTYYFRLNTVDDVSRWSGYSNIASVFMADIYAPTVITNLAATSTLTEGQVSLTWTAPDSDAGAEWSIAATEYRLRFSTTSVDMLLGNTTAWWNQAQEQAGMPVPSVPGTAETYNTLMPHYGVTYYFAIRSEDLVGNLSDIDINAATPYRASHGDADRFAAFDGWELPGY